MNITIMPSIPSSEFLVGSTLFVTTTVVSFSIRTFRNKKPRATEISENEQLQSKLRYDRYLRLNDQARRVMQFWFNGNVSENYKSKWFPSSSADIQKKADDTVHTDFGNLFKLAINDELTDWDNSESYEILAKIIVFDQFSRHIYRNLPPSADERKYSDARALVLAERLIDCPEWNEHLSVPEFVFALMPFRHSSTIPRLRMILDQIQIMNDKVTQYSDLLEKFRKQTVRRLQHLEDRAKVEAAGDLLERHYFSADETNILSEPLVQTTERFLKKYFTQAIANNENSTDYMASSCIAISLSGGVDSMVLSKILSVLRDNNRINIVTRNNETNHLGVDIQQSNNPTFKILAMHIDYSNRPESGEEAAFVKHWAVDQLGLEWRLRVISEVTRGVTDRSDYEKISRTIRYTFYKACLREFWGPVDDVSGDHFSQRDGDRFIGPGIGVIFGHHIGDVQENVISNVMRGGSPLYLSGMAEQGESEGVSVWRPLLKHTKDDIYKFAHKYGVPYLQDTTPSWSTRGKLRNSLLPLLQEIYGTGCLNSLSALAAESDGMRTLVQDNVFGPFLRTVVRNPCGVTVPLWAHRHQSLAFWMEMLKQLMHSMSMSLVREKSVATFMERIQRTTSRGKISSGNGDYSCDGNMETIITPGWIELRKGFNVYIDDRNNLCILPPGVLRPSGSVIRRAKDDSHEPAIVDVSSVGATLSTPGSVDILICDVSELNSTGGKTSETIDKFLAVSSPAVSFTTSSLIKCNIDQYNSSEMGSVIAEFRISGKVNARVGNLFLKLNSNNVRSNSDLSWVSDSAGKYTKLPNCSGKFHLCVEVGNWFILLSFAPSVPLSTFEELRRSSSNIEALIDPHETSESDEEDVWRVASGGGSHPLSRGNSWDWEATSGVNSHSSLLRNISEVMSGHFFYNFIISSKHCAPIQSDNNDNCVDDEVDFKIPLRIYNGVTAGVIRDSGVDTQIKALEIKLREGLPVILPFSHVDSKEKSGGKKVTQKNNSDNYSHDDKVLGRVHVTYYHKRVSQNIA